MNEVLKDFIKVSLKLSFNKKKNLIGNGKNGKAMRFITRLRVFQAHISPFACPGLHIDAYMSINPALFIKVALLWVIQVNRGIPSR